MDYTDLGYNKSFQRLPSTQQITSNQIPTLSPYTVNSIIQALSASKIKGGILQSTDGKLLINLDSGTIQYNDGVVSLLTLGGSNGELTLKDNNNNILVANK